jgi:hypothetical protein
MIVTIPSSFSVWRLIRPHTPVIMFSIAVSILRFGLVLLLSLAEPRGPITRQVFANPRFVGVELGGVVEHC